MSKLKTIKIKEDLHTKIKDYCDTNGLKLGKLVEKLITSHLEKDNGNKWVNEAL